jgi:hypothetical protein
VLPIERSERGQRVEQMRPPRRTDHDVEFAVRSGRALPGETIGVVEPVSAAAETLMQSGDRGGQCLAALVARFGTPRPVMGSGIDAGEIMRDGNQ